MILGEKQHVRVIGSILGVTCPFVFSIAVTVVPSFFFWPSGKYLLSKDPHPLDTLTFALIKERVGRLKLLLNRPVWEAAGSF